MRIEPSWCTWDKEESGQPCATPGCLRAAPARRRPNHQAPRAAARRWTDLAEQLCGLEGRRLAAVLGLADEALSDAVELAKRIPRRNQGRRRQVNLVGKLLREQPDAESARLEARAPLHTQCDTRPAAHADGDTRPTAASCPILPWLADRDRQASVGLPRPGCAPPSARTRVAHVGEVLAGCAPGSAALHAPGAGSGCGRCMLSRKSRAAARAGGCGERGAGPRPGRQPWRRAPRRRVAQRPGRQRPGAAPTERAWHASSPQRLAGQQTAGSLSRVSKHVTSVGALCLAWGPALRLG